MVNVKRLLVVAINVFTLLLLIHNVYAGNGKIDVFSKDFSYVMVKNLLNLSDSEDKKQKLLDWREWDKYTAEILKKEKLTNEEVKAYLLILLITDSRGKVNTSEYISETIIKRLDNNINYFMDTLNELPYFIPIAAKFINEHFITFPGVTDKQEFIDKNKGIILYKLGENKGKDFIRNISQ